MSEYVQGLYGTVTQQLQGALVPDAVNMNTGNLIHELPNGMIRGGDIGAVIAPATILAMQQLYGKSKKKKSRRSRKSRRYRTRGGDMGAFVVPGTILAAQQLYGRKKPKRTRRFRKYRKTR